MCSCPSPPMFSPAYIANMNPGQAPSPAWTEKLRIKLQLFQMDLDDFGDSYGWYWSPPEFKPSPKAYNYPDLKQSVEGEGEGGSLSGTLGSPDHNTTFDPNVEGLEHIWTLGTTMEDPGSTCIQNAHAARVTTTLPRRMAPHSSRSKLDSATAVTSCSSSSPSSQQRSMRSTRGRCEVLKPPPGLLRYRTRGKA